MSTQLKMFFPLLAAFALLAAPLAAWAQTYPAKPIRMLVGFAPGGGTDTAARAIAAKLGERLGQTVVIDNRPGAAGNIATELTVNAPADGYTLLLGSISSFSINPSLYKKLSFDPLKDLAPLTRAADSTNILVTHPTVAAKTVKDLIVLAKTKSLNGGSSGIGGSGHLAIELFNLQTGSKITHVPYKGGGPAMIDLLGGNIHLIFATAASAVQHIKSNKINALGVTTLKRWGFMPEIPTIAEAGVAGFEANNWYGFMMPLKTPQPIIARLNKEIGAILVLPEVKDYLFRQGLDVAPGTPQAFAEYIKSETVKWEKVVKAAGLYHSN
jgi:tripartite-type tricarboxylate transporter receptor subunit TctC